MTLVEFLVHAKTRGYATQGDRNELTLDDGGKELVCRTGDFVYRDRYYGFNPFVGEELVWRDGAVIWAMNYYGVVGDAESSCIEVYRFLQRALREVDRTLPFRGPARFTDGELAYENRSSGSLEHFSGVETISRGGQRIYELRYHGGSVGGDQ